MVIAMDMTFSPWRFIKCHHTSYIRILECAKMDTCIPKDQMHSTIASIINMVSSSFLIEQEDYIDCRHTASILQ